MQKRAFTLIELAIVITIIGLLIGGSFKVMKMMRESAKTTEAKELVLGAKNAVLGYAAKEYFLPLNSEFDANLSTSKVPNHPIFYTADSSIQNDDICAFSSTGLKVSNRGSIIDDVAFVVAHEGANYNMQTTLTSGTVTIHGADEQVDDNTTPVNIVESYDDIVEWVTLKQLQDEVGCVNKQFRFATDKLPNGKVGVQYPSVSGTAKLEVENALPGETVDVNCTPKSQFGIDFNTTTNAFDFYGTPTTAAILQFDCNATVSNSAQFAQKKFVITIDPNYNKETNASCSLDSECGGGYCVNGHCSSGLSGNVCVDGGDCVSGYCAGGICTTGAAGASCDNDGNCQSGICVSGTCQTGAFDAPCVDNYDCKSGICQGGLCSGYLGDLCTANNQCLSGYCDANSSTCGSIPYDTNGSSGGGSGGGGGGGGSGSAPSCMLAGSPSIVDNNQATTLSYSITDGPVSGTFTPSGGSCTSFTNSTGGSCTSANLTRNTSFVLSISNAYGSGSCNTSVCVATTTGYRVWNNTGTRRYFKVDGNCRRISNGSEIRVNSSTRLNSGESIIQYSSTDRSCTTQQATITFNQAVCADADADGLVNFSGTDR